MQIRPGARASVFVPGLLAAVLAGCGGGSGGEPLPQLSAAKAAQLTGRRALSLLTPYAPALACLQLRALTGLALPPMYLDLLTYGQVLDCRKFESAFDWRPKLASREVIMEFVRRTRSGQAAEQTALVPHERELQSYLRSRGSA